MGIYIKNKEMPKSCVKCRWYYELYDEHCTLGKFLLRKYPTDVSEEPYILDTQRHPDCPLEEIDLVRCGECKWWDSDDGNIGYCHAEKHCHFSSNWEISIYRKYKYDHYCSDGERRE